METTETGRLRLSYDAKEECGLCRSWKPAAEARGIFGQKLAFAPREGRWRIDFVACLFGNSKAAVVTAL